MTNRNKRMFTISGIPLANAGSDRRYPVLAGACVGIAPLVYRWYRWVWIWAARDRMRRSRWPGPPATGPIEMKPGNSAVVKPEFSPKAVRPRLPQARGQAARVNPTLSEKFGGFVIHLISLGFQDKARVSREYRPRHSIVGKQVLSEKV